MIGIYLLKNKINGKGYVGQSIDIERRYNEHRRSSYPEKYSQKNDRDSHLPIHRSIHKYGIENFELIILEECNKEELNKKEKYWITELKTNIRDYGYNVSNGGQDTFGLKGENHSQAKLTLEEVNEIKKLLKNTELSLEEIRIKFPKIKSKSMISLINTGKNWYDKNIDYPIRKSFKNTSIGENNPRAKFNEQQVMEIRTLYSKGKTLSEIVELYKHIATYSAIKAIIYGQSYKHLPIWKKKENKWIEPCIDYSLS